jgi:hypothetical protein
MCVKLTLLTVLGCVVAIVEILSVDIQLVLLRAQYETDTVETEKKDERKSGSEKYISFNLIPYPESTTVSSHSYPCPILPRTDSKARALRSADHPRLVIR